MLLQKSLIPLSAVSRDGNGLLQLRDYDKILDKVGRFIDSNTHFVNAPLTDDTYKTAKDERANINNALKEVKKYRLALLHKYTGKIVDEIKAIEKTLSENEKGYKKVVDAYQAEHAIGQFKNSELKPTTLTITIASAGNAEKVKAYAEKLGAVVVVK